MTSIQKIMARSVQKPLNFLLAPLVMFFMLQCSNGDISSDQKECTDQLVSLATCLPYVEGSAKVPTPDCCSGLKEVLSKSPKCLCVLIKDRDDPQLGIKINVSLALALPVACDRPVKISECPKLLKLPPNSPDALIFTQPQKAAQGNASKTTAAEGNMTSASQNSGSMSSTQGRHYRRGEWWMIKMLAGSLLPLAVFM